MNQGEFDATLEFYRDENKRDPERFLCGNCDHVYSIRWTKEVGGWFGDDTCPECGCEDDATPL